MREIRVFFTKLGDARFISHLDMNRVFLRAVRRTDIPIWYTEGFNPHPYFSFSLPLSLGVESESECFDMRLNDDSYPDSKVLQSFNAVLPENIQVTRVAPPVMEPKKIYCGIFTVTYNTSDPTALASELEEILSRKELTAPKKQKSGKRKVVVDVNLLQGVITYTVSKGEGVVTLKLLLLSGISSNINPVLLTNTIAKECTQDCSDVKIRKIALFDEFYKEFS